MHCYSAPFNKSVSRLATQNLSGVLHWVLVNIGVALQNLTHDTLSCLNQGTIMLVNVI